MVCLKAHTSSHYVSESKSKSHSSKISSTPHGLQPDIKASKVFAKPKLQLGSSFEIKFDCERVAPTQNYKSGKRPQL